MAFATTLRGLDTEVVLEEADGMPPGCALNLDTPELVPKTMLGERIGVLPSSRMGQAARAANC